MPLTEHIETPRTGLGQGVLVLHSWFFERDRADAFHPAAAEAAWERTIDFLKTNLGDAGQPGRSRKATR